MPGRVVESDAAVPDAVLVAAFETGALVSEQQAPGASIASPPLER